MKTKTKSKLLMVVDGNHLAHRCRHVFSLSYRGKDVSVTYGFLKVLSTMLDKFRPYAVIVAWDGGVPEFRRKAVPEYKANRKHGSDDPLSYAELIRQMNELSDYVLPMMGVVSIRKYGAEADDLAYHASRISSENTVIVSGDKDLLQAISPKTMVYAKDKIYDMVTFSKEYDISLSNYIDWRALQGDGSDNIPGIPGVGEKTATKLFKEIGSLTGITNAALGHNPYHTLTGKLAENISNFGFDRIAKAIYVMALYADRVGAKRAIIDGCEGWTPMSKKRFHNYLMQNAFVSLTEYIGHFQRLEKPELYLKNLRIPVANMKRYPV